MRACVTCVTYSRGSHSSAGQCTPGNTGHWQIKSSLNIGTAGHTGQPVLHTPYSTQQYTLAPYTNSEPCNTTANTVSKPQRRQHRRRYRAHTCDPDRSPRHACQLRHVRGSQKIWKQPVSQIFPLAYKLPHKYTSVLKKVIRRKQQKVCKISLKKKILSLGSERLSFLLSI